MRAGTHRFSRFGRQGQPLSSRTRRGGRALAALLGATIATASVVGVAAADDISNNLDASIDAVAEVMPLNVGGANGTTQLYVAPTGGDGKSGCNLTGSTTLVVSVASSDTAVATVSPGSITFTSCGATPTLTVTPVAAGSATISVSQTSNSTGGTFNLAPATFTVNVTSPAPANTAPSVTVTGVTGGASYDKGSVPAATCEVTDAEDGDSSFAATLTAVTGPYASDGIGSQTASCSYTDAGGLTASASETYSIADPTAPVIIPTVTGALGNDGWYVSDVTLVWTVFDAESPNSIQVTGCVDQSITVDQAETSYSCAATGAGGSAAEQTVTIKRDATDPSVTCGSPDGAWHAADVSIACTASDGGSGLADSADTGFSLSTNVASDSETDDASTGSHEVSDAAGNTSTAGPIGGNKVDKKAPSTSCGAADDDWHADDVTIDCTAGDGGSGLADSADANFSLSTNVAPGTETDDASTGSHEVSDGVGNSSTAGPIGGNKVDKKAPELTDSGPTTDPNGAGWYKAEVTNTFAASDGGSGLQSPCAATFTKSSGSDEGTAVKIASGACEDQVGNSNSGIDSAAFKIDLMSPSVTVTGVANGATYTLGQVPAAGCNTSDGLSGVKISAAESSSGGPLGSVTVTCSGAEDVAGNTNSASATYNVVYAWNGFFQPIDNNGVYNQVNAGRTIPAKWSLGGNQGLDILAAGSPSSVQVTCPSSAPVDALEETSTATVSGLKYDPSADQYIYNWTTLKTYAGTCRRFTVKLADDTVHSALFKFTK
jgi:hypothetical protein